MTRGAGPLAVAAAVVVAAGCGSGTRMTYPNCAARTGAGAYDTTLHPSSGSAGSTVSVAGHLPVVNEAGVDVGQSATHVDVYWNLDFDKWWSVLGRKPRPLSAIAGLPVRHLGKQDVAKLCRYQLRVHIPPVPPGTYSIEVLSGDSHGTASFAPADFHVTGG